MLTWAKLFQTVQYDLMKWFIQFIHQKKKKWFIGRPAFLPRHHKVHYTGKLLRCTFHCSIPWLKQSFTSLIHLHWNCTATATWLIDLLFPKTTRTIFFLCCRYFLQWKTQKSLIEKQKKQAHVSVDRRKSHFWQPGNGCVMPFSRK